MHSSRPLTTAAARSLRALCVSWIAALAASCAHPALVVPPAQPVLLPSEQGAGRGSGPAARAADAPSVADPGALREARVESMLQRSLPDGCRYTADVRGTLAPREVRPSSLGNRAQWYRAELVVAASVICPQGTRYQSGPRRVSGRAVAREALLRAVDEASSVELPGATRRCAARGEYAFSGDTLYGADVRERCGAPDERATP